MVDIILRSMTRLIPLRVVYRYIDQAKRYGPSLVPSYTIGLITEGRASYRLDRHQEKGFDCPEGTMVWLPKGVFREAVFEAPRTKLFSVQFDLDDEIDLLGSENLSKILQSPKTFSPRDPAQITAMMRKIHTLWLQTHPLAFLEVQGLLLQVMAEIGWALETSDVPPHIALKVDTAMAYLHKHYADPSLSVARLARLTDWSEKYFLACFRRVTGQTPMQYLRRIRINHAIELLSVGEYPVADVARQVGYLDPAYFSRVFRQTVGIPPSKAPVRGADPIE